MAAPAAHGVQFVRVPGTSHPQPLAWDAGSLGVTRAVPPAAGDPASPPELGVVIAMPLTLPPPTRPPVPIMLGAPAEPPRPSVPPLVAGDPPVPVAPPSLPPPPALTEPPAPTEPPALTEPPAPMFPPALAPPAP